MCVCVCVCVCHFWQRRRSCLHAQYLLTMLLFTAAIYYSSYYLPPKFRATLLAETVLLPGERVRMALERLGQQVRERERERESVCVCERGEGGGGGGGREGGYYSR